MSYGATAGYFNLQFRLLMDDVNSSRFTDIQINQLIVMSTQDVKNAMRAMGWDMDFSNNEDVTISSGSQEQAMSVSAIGYGFPLWVRRNETNDKSVIQVMREIDAVKSIEPVVYITYSGSAWRLGYYKEATQDLKFTVFFTNDTNVSFSLTTYDENQINYHLPYTYSNLILYRACALASSTDSKARTIWDNRYIQVLQDAVSFMGPRQDRVMDVYDAYGSN